MPQEVTIVKLRTLFEKTIQWCRASPASPSVTCVVWPKSCSSKGGGHKSETLGLVNTLEKVTPPKVSIRVLGSVSALGSQILKT